MSTSLPLPRSINYGKRKKSLTAGFTVFRDEPSSQQPCQHHTPKKTMNHLYGKFRARHTPVRHSKSTSIDDASLNELEGLALLDSVPRHSFEPPTQHARKHLSWPDRTPSEAEPVKVVEEETQSIRRKGRPHEAQRELLIPQVLQDLDQTPKAGMHEVQHALDSLAILNNGSSAGSRIKRLCLPGSASSELKADAGALSKLKAQALVHRQESERRSAILANFVDKSSPYKRGKEAFAKARQLFRTHLADSPIKTSSNFDTEVMPKSSYRMDAGYSPLQLEFAHERDQVVDHGRSQQSQAGLEDPTKPDYAPNLMSNLYETMRSFTPTETNHDTKEVFVSGPGVECEPKAPANSRSKPDRQSDTLIRAKATARELQLSDTAKRGPRITTQKTGFSYGLEQHSDTMFFSSSPLAQSTPPKERMMLPPYPQATFEGRGRNLNRRLHNASPRSRPMTSAGQYSGTRSIARRKHSRANLRHPMTVNGKSERSTQLAKIAVPVDGPQKGSVRPRKVLGEKDANLKLDIQARTKKIPTSKDRATTRLTEKPSSEPPRNFAIKPSIPARGKINAAEKLQIGSKYSGRLRGSPQHVPLNERSSSDVDELAG